MSLVDNFDWQEKVSSKEVEANTVSVHKFGGSSLKDANAIEQVVSIIDRECGPNDVVVLSAMGKTTDLLIEVVQQHSLQDSACCAEPDVEAIRNYQRKVIDGVLSKTKSILLQRELDIDIQRIEYLLSHIDDDGFNRADIIGFGELWSTRLICAALGERNISCYRADSRDFIYTKDSEASGDIIDWEKSQLLFDDCKSEFRNNLVVTCGYIASGSSGNTVTLGRNGSDFSATIIARLVKAKTVYLWTDVNGVFSGDPRVIADTKAIPALGIHEANSIAKLGTSVFHEKTLKPLWQSQIPVRVANCKAALADPNTKGTLVSPKKESELGAKTIAYKESVCLFRIKWQTPSLMNHLNMTLKRLLVTKSISYFCWDADGGELSFCVLNSDHTQVAKLLTRKEVGESCEFSVNNGLSIISLVGHNLLSHGKDLSKYYSHIEGSQSQIFAYHYDGEGAVSAVIKHDDPLSLVRGIHQDIFVVDAQLVRNESKRMNIVIYGCGNIGRELLSILDRRLEIINKQLSQKIVVVAVCNSRHFIFDSNGIDLTHAIENLSQKDSNEDTISSVSYLEGQIQSLSQGKVCIVDVTASMDVTNSYIDHFSNGRHIVSAGKLALTLSQQNYEQLIGAAKVNDCEWLSNVSCGAGLPIQQSIKDLNLCGDRIKSIEGVLSGSLSWILSKFNDSTSFSTIVRQAKELGLTEPDPRDDLSGKDVQRKLLIIARTLGVKLNLDKIQLSPLIPSKYFELSAQEFSKCDEELDLFMKEKWKHAKEHNMKLCYGAEIKFGRQREELSLLEANVGLSFRPTDDPMVVLEAADNIVVIRSDWHDKNPLIIRGPGAGVEVTAAGVVSDLIKLCK